MHVHAMSSRRRRLLGLWLGLLALCALNLNVAGHYQRMLVEDALCSAAGGVAGAELPKQHGIAHTLSDCALNCALEQSSPQPEALATVPTVVTTARVAQVAQVSDPQTSGRRAHQPRAPPSVA